MELWQALLFGLVQGITEFLPVSSSGHLRVAEHFFGMTEPLTAFDLSLHAGSLLAVLVFFRKDIWELVIAPFRIPGLVRKEGWRGLWADPGLRGIVFVVLGSIPTAVIGYKLGPHFESMAESITFVAIMFMVNGVVLLLSRVVVLPLASRRRMNKGFRGISLLDALIIGTAQGFAVIRGISRSGSTISVGMMMGLDRETSGRFSFLLFLPAVLGAEVLALFSGHIELTGVTPEIAAAGAVAAALSGLLALWLLMALLRRGSLHRFGWYTLLLGAILLAWLNYGTEISGGLEAIFHG